jgi:hypothetical protein
MLGSLTAQWCLALLAGTMLALLAEMPLTDSSQQLPKDSASFHFSSLVWCYLAALPCGKLVPFGSTTAWWRAGVGSYRELVLQVWTNRDAGWHLGTCAG